MIRTLMPLASRRAILRGGAAALAAGLVPSAMGPALAQEADWDKVVAAAKKEGGVMVYGNGPVLRALVAQFGKTYGLDAQMLDARASETRERVRTEQMTGRVNADVFTSGAVTTTNMAREGRFVSHGALPNVAKIAAPFKDDGTLLPYTANVLTALVNSKLVKPEEDPKSWKDMLDPKWTGEVLLDEPRTGGVGYVFFAVTYERFGREYQEKFAALKPVIAPDPAIAARRLAAGEFALYVGFAFHEYKGLKGLPIRVVFPEEGGMYSTLNAAMVKGAPHPNAARLFMNFMVSDEGQGVVASFGSRTTTGFIPDDLPDDLRRLLNVKLFGASDPDDQDAMNKLAREIYK